MWDGCVVVVLLGDLGVRRDWVVDLDLDLEVEGVEVKEVGEELWDEVE